MKSRNSVRDWRIVGAVEAGVPQADVAALFGVSKGRVWQIFDAAKAGRLQGLAPVPPPAAKPTPPVGSEARSTPRVVEPTKVINTEPLVEVAADCGMTLVQLFSFFASKGVVLIPVDPRPARPERLAAE